MATEAQLKKQIKDAEQELHNLEIGIKPRVLVDQNGERIEYTMTTANKLRNYIASLKNQLSPSTNFNKPMRPIF